MCTCGTESSTNYLTHRRGNDAAPIARALSISERLDTETGHGTKHLPGAPPRALPNAIHEKAHSGIEYRHKEVPEIMQGDGCTALLGSTRSRAQLGPRDLAMRAFRPGPGATMTSAEVLATCANTLCGICATMKECMRVGLVGSAIAAEVRPALLAVCSHMYDRCQWSSRPHLADNTPRADATDYRLNKYRCRRRRATRAPVSCMSRPACERLVSQPLGRQATGPAVKCQHEQRQLLTRALKDTA